jgi:uncharacterized phiE125 gp8 family phage protein
MYDLKDITPSVTEPISLSELKTYLRIPSANTSDDTHLSQLLTAGRIKFEKAAWRSVVPHMYRLTVSEFESPLELPYPPIDYVDTVEYWDGSEWHELDESDDYFVFGDNKKEVECAFYDGYKMRVTFATLGDNTQDYLNLIKEWIGAVYDNRPDSEQVQEKIVNRMAGYRAQSAR